MATWPENLPGPLRTLSVQAGNNSVSREAQSGRREVRRFGIGAPDKISVQFRLFNEDVAAFENWFDRSANLGVNWFSAPWLASMGYDSHMARILGYPKRKGKGVRYSDYSVTLLIQEAAYCPEDVEWLSGATGSGSAGPEPSPEGLVVAWGSSSTAQYQEIINELPSELYATKVVGGYGFGAALKEDGTIEMWGHASSLSTYFSGWDDLGGIKDIAACAQTLLYLTDSGIIGAIGRDADDLYECPSISDGVSIHSTSSSGLVVREDGSLSSWGYTGTMPDPPTALSDPAFLAGNRFYEFAAIDQDGTLYVWGAHDSYGVISGAPVVPNAVCVGASRYGGVVYQEDGTFQQWGTRAPSEDPPVGLVPSEIVMPGHYCAFAIHNDGTVVGWGITYGAISYLPDGLKAHQIWTVTRDVAVAIQMADD